jgi:cation diffusion facilitator family transporter
MQENLINHDSVDNVIKRQVAKKSTLISVFVNFILGSIQIFFGFISHSSALIADGIHSLSDLVSDFVVLFANHHSSKSADEDHNYGHQRFENAASLFLGLSLIGVGIMMLWSAGHKIIFSNTTSQIQIQALWVAISALIIKEILFRYMLRVATQVRSSMLVANAWHARSDAASSFLVAIGIIGSLMGYPVLDIVGALIVGLIIAKTGFKFSWNALHDLMDRATSVEETAKILQLIISSPEVKGCHNLRTRKMGDAIFVDVHIELDGDMTVRRSHDIVDDIRQNVNSQLPVFDMMIHIDPVENLKN